MALTVDNRNMFSNIDEINSDRSTWNLKAKIIRLWQVSDFNRPNVPFSVEMVLMDSDGAKIHATIKKTLIYKFKHDLIEGKVYSFENLGVASNNGGYRTTHHPYKLNFQFGSFVQRLSNCDIVKSPFTFVPIAEVVGGLYDTDFLVDVIGFLTEIGQEREITNQNGSTTKLNVISLEADGHKLQCTLFGPYVDELNTFVGAGDLNNAVERIDICPTFVKNFESIIDFSRPVSIRNSNHRQADALLKCRKGVWYLTGGFKVANIFGFKKPTNVFLDFQFKDNQFVMIQKRGGKTSPVVKSVGDKTPVIILSSDEDDDDHEDDDDDDEDDDHDEDDDDDDDNEDEDDNEDDDDDMLQFLHVSKNNSMHADEDDLLRHYNFDIKITESMAYTKQVLHFPNKTSKHVLPAKQDNILMRDVSSGRVISCTIITSSRYKNERYLGDGWYQFKDEFKLNPGDVLKCSIENPPQYMNVMIIRAASP
ncbi:unnamed protein product [Trifolium pratense]|uniref:Uncharacterized protein n=1 Tax=Trifolium pratense TaxID=57577 RepID=A0ACB0J361_TRIPR|nr:unnamed protein product [Trifolium pratense]